MSPQTVLLRTTLTRTITIYRIKTQFCLLISWLRQFQEAIPRHLLCIWQVVGLHREAFDRSSLPRRGGVFFSLSRVKSCLKRVGGGAVLLHYPVLIMSFGFIIFFGRISGLNLFFPISFPEKNNNKQTKTKTKKYILDSAFLSFIKQSNVLQFIPF